MQKASEADFDQLPLIEDLEHTAEWKLLKQRMVC